MQDVLLRSLSFVMIIFIAYILKRLGAIKAEHRAVLSRVVMTLTLPCALLVSLSGATEGGSLVFTGFGFLCTMIPLLFNFLTTGKYAEKTRAFYMLNASGYNIGCFVLPFAQTFFSADAVLVTCMFDAGNAILVTGGSYAFTNASLKLNGRVSVSGIIKQLFSSVPLDVYIAVLMLSAFSVPVPEPVITVITPAANANAFIAMFLIGMMLELKVPGEEKKIVIRTILTRLAFSLAFALVFYFLTPFPPETRQILCLLSFAPASALAPLFSEKANANGTLSGFANSVSIIISVFAMMLFIFNMQI